jgi:hypothetical protein
MDRGPMDVERIGARFERRDQAIEAMLDLRRRFGLAAAEIDVRDLGSTAYERPASGTLLAGQFPAEVAETAVGIIIADGGVILERRPEPDPTRVLGVVGTLEPPPETSGRRFRRSRH